MDADSPSSLRKRRRPTLACEPCRKKKIRCDREMPCDHCIRSTKENCHYRLEDVDEGGGATAVYRTSPAAALRPSAVSRSASYQQRPAVNPIRDLTPVHETHFSPTGIPTPRTAGSVTQEPSKNSPEVEIAPLETSSNTRGGNVLSSEPRLRDSAYSPSFPPGPGEDPSVHGAFSKTRFFGQSHWTSGIHQFSELLRVIHVIGGEHRELRSTFEECKALARASKTQGLVNQPIVVDPRDYVLSKPKTDELVKAYLRTVAYIYRVLHVPSFLREYDDYWADPNSASQEFLMKLLLIMAIGSAFTSNDEDIISDRSLASQWIHTAQYWLSSPFGEKSRLNLAGVQVHCLLLIARQIIAVRGDLVWLSAGSLLNTAMAIGLHIDPSFSPKMTFYDAEIRRRLWAVVLELCVQSAMDAGATPLITSRDYDCKLPCNIDDVQLEENISSATEPSPQPLEIFTDASLQVALARSLPIRLEIVRFINAFRSGYTYAEALRLASELSSICRASSILFRTFTEDNRPSGFQLKLLDLLTHRFLLALHHPFAVKAKGDPTFYFSRKVSLEVSLSLVSPPPNTISQDNDYSRLTSVGGGIFRAVPLQAISIIGDELISQFEEEKTLFTSTATAGSTAARKALREAIENYVKLAAARIQYGETGIKNHIVFSCLLAQVDATFAGVPVRPAISSALRKCLIQSHSVLKARSEDLGASPPETPANAEMRPGDARSDAGGLQGWFSKSNRTPSSFMDLDAWLSANLLPSQPWGDASMSALPRHE